MDGDGVQRERFLRRQANDLCTSLLEFPTKSVVLPLRLLKVRSMRESKLLPVTRNLAVAPPCILWRADKNSLKGPDH